VGGIFVVQVVVAILIMVNLDVYVMFLDDRVIVVSVLLLVIFL
jgi:hypothetical protein